MNYFLATASYEHPLPQYLECGFSLFKSLPHQLQQRYNGLIFFFIKTNYFTVKLFSNFSSFFKGINNFFSMLPKLKKFTFPIYLSIFKFATKVFHNLMTKFTHNWSGKRFFNRPTSFKTIFQNTPFKTHIFRPLRKWFSNSFVSKQPIICAIKVLLPKANPSTILFRIMSVRIYAVNTHSNFARFLVRFIHILLKFFKGLPQNLYTPTAITLEAIVLGILTPLLHTAPNIIKSCSRHSMLHAFSLANGGMIVNQFYTPLWTTKSQLTDIWKKANKK